jgi:hypothetical protein
VGVSEIDEGLVPDLSGYIHTHRPERSLMKQGMFPLNSLAYAIIYVNSSWHQACYSTHDRDV